jgi:serine/threonine-protein kinase
MASEPHFDGCEVVERLRSGPATDWYLGRQRSLGRAVVIKALSPNVLPESPFAGPLAQEARMLARLQHRNIVQLYDFVERPQNTWLVLEHVDGVNLEELLERSKKLSPVAALAIGSSVVRTLEYVHSRGIVHRDVQPKNILLSRQGDVKLSNFYLAAERSTPPPPELLEADSGFVSPSYMSPEQLLSEPTDPRSDLFSVGVILYEMLTGQQPFAASDTRTTTQRIRHEPPPAISRIVPDIPPPVERIVLRALQKLPADRFHDASEMALMMERALAQFGSPPARKVILEELGKAGIVEPQTTTTLRPAKVVEGPSTLRRALYVYSTCAVLLVVGGWAIERHTGNPAPTRTMAVTTSPVSPETAARLACVVTPWADVFVDGRQVETTPFAHPILLSPGVHYLRFDHPDAPSEHRTVDVAPRQFLELDIEMQLRTPIEEIEVPPTTAPPPDAGDRSP